MTLSEKKLSAGQSIAGMKVELGATDMQVPTPELQVECRLPDALTSNNAGSASSASSEGHSSGYLETGKGDLSKTPAVTQIADKGAELAELAASDKTPCSEGVEAPSEPASELAGSTVETGILADGTINPDYKIVQGGERGTEVVSYAEWQRRVKLADLWVEPVAEIRWEGIGDY